MKKQVLVAPSVDKSEASVRKSLDYAFCHLFNSSKIVLYCAVALPGKTVFKLLHRKFTRDSFQNFYYPGHRSLNRNREEIRLARLKFPLLLFQDFFRF